MSLMETCRWEFVAITLMALTGELEEAEFIRLREDSADFDWADVETDDDAFYYYELMEVAEALNDLEWY
jgi:hypothetical protein